MPKQLEDFLCYPPIPKTTSLQSSNYLRPIAITPLLILICKDFVFDWAYPDINTSIDLQQLGNMKPFSTVHYLVSFLEIVYSHLDKRNISLAIACVDFRKLFPVDHTVVIIINQATSSKKFRNEHLRSFWPLLSETMQVLSPF